MAARAASEPPVRRVDPPASGLRGRELQPLAEVLADSVQRVREAFLKEQRFLGDAAHELKTAVAVTRSSVQLLMLRPRTEGEYRSGLERVLEDNGRAERLIAQMLALSSAEGAPASPATTDLGWLAADVTGALQSLADERGVQLSAAGVTALRVRLAPDDGRLLVSNLLLNALEHSHGGQQVRLHAAAAGPGEVELRVEDSGSGIAPEALPHVFERFFREDRSRSRATGGTGLGLSISKAIVDAAGGRIAIRSQPGEGTCVTVTFIRA